VLEKSGGRIEESDPYREHGVGKIIDDVLGPYFLHHVDAAWVADRRDVACLVGLESLRRLDLSNIAVTDGDLLSIRSLQTMENLNLANSNISDAGMNSVKELQRLRVLDVTNCRISDKGLMCLHNLEHIELLYVHGTNVSVQGKQLLSQRIPGVRIYGGGATGSKMMSPTKPNANKE
jgi:Leucine-rich repeat (LRR) protein